MGHEVEGAVRAFVAELDGDRWDAAQIERILDRMAPDAHYKVYAWEQALVGRDAIRQELERQMPLFRDLHCDVRSIASNGATVHVERLDSMRIGRVPFSLHVAAVFEVDDKGRIASWREYYDSKEIAAQLGADVSTAGDRA